MKGGFRNFILFFLCNFGHTLSINSLELFDVFENQRGVGVFLGK